jgi:DNA-binding XRE family transcriptional regulator
MIPLFQVSGALPPGEHRADWDEIVERFGWSPKRRRLLEGLRRACLQLRQGSVKRLFLNGSFVTSKEAPNDYDACWPDDELEDADQVDPVLFDFSAARALLPVHAGRRREGNYRPEIGDSRMIKTDKQLKATRELVKEFQQAIAKAESGRGRSTTKPEASKAYVAGLRSQLEQLTLEITRYERLKGGDLSLIAVGSLDDLPRSLVETRIARGKSQSELARELGVAPQQVQRWEADDYQSASFPMLCEIARLLGVSLSRGITIERRIRAA